MPRKKKREVSGGVEITSFFATPPPKEGVEGRREGPAPTPLPTADVEGALLKFLRQGARTKSEIYEWARSRRIPPAALYRALLSLQDRGLIKKYFDGERNELAYSLTSA